VRARGPAVSLVGVRSACRAADETLAAAREEQARVSSPNDQFNAWLQRSAADLAMLSSGNPESGYPYAGVPWYSVPFGRDGILTAMQYLWVDPRMARGVLTFLAETQATELDPARDAEPGKIVHEMRKGELAALREIPFGRYYGTIDATPLFVVLAGEYHQRTGDSPLLHHLWPAIERALAWIDEFGDPDGDGFVEYHRRSGDGLVNQAWKDSEDSIFHEDGALARGPIAVCEVQAYVYSRSHPRGAPCAHARARRAGAEARAPGRSAARALRGAVLDETLGTYVIALDGEKRPCRVRSSNAGHVLWCGIASEERGRAAGRTLLSPIPSRGGACAPSPRASRATTRCRITTGRSGRTTTPSSRWDSRATA
jgi:glycogen debranching enzyme